MKISMPFKKRQIDTYVSKRHRCWCQPKIPRERRPRVERGREIERRDIARALAREAFSASWCERSMTGRGDRINRKTRRFVRVPPRICRDARGHRSNLEVQHPRQIHTYYPHRHNKLPHVRGVAALPVVYFNERSDGIALRQLNDGPLELSQPFEDQEVMANLNSKG